MRKDWVLTQEAFDAFLRWLSPDREQSAVQYEKIRRKLIVFFEFKGSDDAELLADETINRVSERLIRAGDTDEKFPIQFIYGTARYIHLERRAAPTHIPLETETLSADFEQPDSDFSDDERNECMTRCLARLEASDRDLIVGYYNVSAENKSGVRERLCRSRGESMGALRVKISRIRKFLQGCQKKCLNREG